MKKNIVFSIVFFALMLHWNQAFAAFDKFYTVASNGSTTEKNHFTTSETPYIYAKLPHTGTNFTLAFWNAPSSLSYFTFDGPGVVQEIWMKLPNWNTIAEVGKWTVNGQYLFAGSSLEGGQASYQFSVSPEPISSGLFLSGGIAFVAAGLRKRRKTAVVA